MPVSFSTYRPVDPMLTGFMATTAPNQKFVGRLTTPRVRVNNPDFIGKLFVDTHVSFMGTPQSLKVAPGAPLPTMKTADPGTATYTCQPYGLASDGIPKLSSARSQLPEDLVQRDLRALKAAVDIAEEIRYATLYQTTGNWTTTAACSALAGGKKWSEIGAQPLSDLRDFVETTFLPAAHQNMPNKLYLPRAVAVAIGRSAEVRGVYYGTTAGLASAQPSVGVAAVVDMLTRELGIEVIITSGGKNTANLGQAHSESNIWTDTVWIGCLNADAAADGRSVRTMHTAALAVDETSPLIENNMGGVGEYWAGVDETPVTQGGKWIPWVMHSAAELVVSADLGATITDCV